MTNHRTPLSAAIRAGLFAGLAGFAAAPAFAQDAASESEAQDLDRIEVTGSRIRSVDTETAQPVLTITRAEIERQGFSSVADILQNTPAVGTPPISRAAPLSAGENVGGQYISLRNLGAARTLILVNGRRLSSTTSGIQDLSSIPAAAVERIEILKDSASTIYGSDAIAGVVNIVTRAGYDGMRASVYRGQYSEGDGETEVVDFVFGHSSDRGSLMIAGEFRDEQRVAASDRAFSAFPSGQFFPNRGWTTVGQFGGFVSSPTVNTIPGLTYPAATAANPNRTVRVVLREGGDPNNLADYVIQNAAAPNGQVSNTNEQTDLRTPLTSRQVFASGDYDINDSVRFFAEANYSSREAGRQVAGYPFQSAAFTNVDTSISADSAFNPFNAPIANWWRRTWEVPRSSESKLEAFRVVAGLEGSFEVGERYFDWDVSYNYGNQQVVQASYGNLNLVNVQRAVGASFIDASGNVVCGTPTAPIAGCVAWNPLLPFGATGPGSLTNNKALQDYLFQTEHSLGETSTEVISANLSGLLFTLPAGDMSFAAGIEHRVESGEFVPDALSVSGLSTNLGARPTRGDYSLDELYLEFQIPLLADVAFARELSINVASRYSDYDTFGDTTNSKVSLSWRPIDDLLVRGTWAEGFRAPTIANLFAGGSQTFASYTDPCDPVYGAASNNAAVRTACASAINGYFTDPTAGNTTANVAFRQLQQGFVPADRADAQTPVPFFSGAANPQLTPETSESKTLGVVYSPSYIEGLTVSLDWWQIELDNTIVADTPNQILSDCYVSGLSSRCGFFTRDGANGIVNTMNYGNRNAGQSNDEGFDFGVLYRVETGFGDFGLNFQSTYLAVSEFKTTDDPNVLLSQGVSFASAAGATFRIRGNAGLDWQYGDFGATWNTRYYSGLKESCVIATVCSNPGYVAANPAQTRPLNEVGANTFHDIQVRWNTPWDAQIAIGANNVFGHEGPQMYTQPSANVPYYGGFDIGRFMYMRYTQSF